MNAAQAKRMSEGIGGFYADHGAAAGACLQAADELDVLSQAIDNGATYGITGTALVGIAARLRVAAELGRILDQALEAAK